MNKNIWSKFACECWNICGILSIKIINVHTQKICISHWGSPNGKANSNRIYLLMNNEPKYIVKKAKEIITFIYNYWLDNSKKIGELTS